MKKRIILQLLLFIFCLPIVVVSCIKKGSDDPFLSFRTRTERLAGEWKLKKYTLEERNTTQVSTTFNNTICDTAGVAGTQTQNQTVNNDFGANQLNSIFSNTIGGIGETFLYDIDLQYVLDIDKLGTYKCRGSYSYFDNVRQEQIEGGFNIRHNPWYWRNDNKTKSAVTFTNFPLIDVKAISGMGVPIRYQDQTFNILRLAHKELVIEYASTIQDTLQQVTNPVTDTSLTTCIRRITTISNIEEDADWEFEQ